MEPDKRLLMLTFFWDQRHVLRLCVVLQGVNAEVLCSNITLLPVIHEESSARDLVSQGLQSADGRLLLWPRYRCPCDVEHFTKINYFFVS